MFSFSTTDAGIGLIGEGGNNRIYLLSRECCGESSAIIRVSKRGGSIGVQEIIDKHRLLQCLGVKTTSFLEVCTLDGESALLTENLHKESYTYLDTNAHLFRDEDNILKSLDSGRITSNYTKEPEEERWFANNKFRGITNLREFILGHISLLKTLSAEHLYIASDCYFFRVSKQQPFTDLDYIIADWDDIGVYCDYCVEELNNINIEQFKGALLQFVDRFVECDACDYYKREIECVFSCGGAQE